MTFPLNLLFVRSLGLLVVSLSLILLFLIIPVKGLQRTEQIQVHLDRTLGKNSEDGMSQSKKKNFNRTK